MTLFLKVFFLPPGDHRHSRHCCRRRVEGRDRKSYCRVGGQALLGAARRLCADVQAYYTAAADQVAETLLKPSGPPTIRVSEIVK